MPWYRETTLQQYPRFRSIGSLPSENPVDPCGAPRNHRRDLAEASENPSERQISPESLAEGCAPKESDQSCLLVCSPVLLSFVLLLSASAFLSFIQAKTFQNKTSTTKICSFLPVRGCLFTRQSGKCPESSGRSDKNGNFVLCYGLFRAYSCSRLFSLCPLLVKMCLEGWGGHLILHLRKDR